MVFDSKREEIPPILSDCLRELDAKNAHLVEGIFRVGGPQKEVKELKMSFDKGNRPDLTPIKDVSTLSSLLKLFFAELDEPIFTFEFYEAFLWAGHFGTPEERKYCLRKVFFQ